MSFRPNDDIMGYRHPLFVPTLENYDRLWNGNFPASFANSLTTSVCLDRSCPCWSACRPPMCCRAGAFARAAQVALWILATRMAPPIAFTIPFFLAYRTSNLLDTVDRPGHHLPHVQPGPGHLDDAEFFDGVPRQLEEAAWIDGCAIWGTFRADRRCRWRRRGWPPPAVLCFILSWNDFFFALILTRTSAMTAPVAIVNFMQYEGWEWGKIAAAGTLVMLPVTLFTFFVRSYLVRGLMAGGVKE